jgi:hypothetical protein
MGPGKYDDVCTRVREETHAVVALIAIIGGDKGNGFSVQAVGGVPPADLAAMLRHMAEQIERIT